MVVLVLGFIALGAMTINQDAAETNTVSKMTSDCCTGMAGTGAKNRTQTARGTCPHQAATACPGLKNFHSQPACCNGSGADTSI
ncbi:MAG: hypothetical protein D6762_07330 [Candidatus Neomarinimicrobiota bacterium]|nr:MAG: hypothetical protein D6762_07330 [Candidatus Neomarinimicrobiota bacterium]